MAREIVTSENRDDYMKQKLGIASEEEQKPLTLYHGTAPDKANKILKEGLKSPEHADQRPNWFMLVDNPEAAKDFGEHVLKVNLPHDAVKQKMIWSGKDSSYGKQYALRQDLHSKYISHHKDEKESK